MHDAIHQSYAAIRRSEPPAMPIVLLHIGKDSTCVAYGTGFEPEQILMLDMGSNRTSSKFFKHNPPSPLEIENAIMIVEDEVTRAREVAKERASLYSTDEMLHDMARLAGYPDESAVTLSLEQVEKLFDQLVARSEGRPSTQVDLTDDPELSATLLILREFMHHLKFDEIKLRQRSPTDQRWH